MPTMKSENNGGKFIPILSNKMLNRLYNLDQDQHVYRSLFIQYIGLMMINFVIAESTA